MCIVYLLYFASYTFVYIASRRGLEELIEKLKEEKKSISADLMVSEERIASLQNKLEHITYENKTCFEAKAEIEVCS